MCKAIISHYIDLKYFSHSFFGYLSSYSFCDSDGIIQNYRLDVKS